MEPEPLVVYRCLVKGHGVKLAGIVSDNGRPLSGFWTSNPGTGKTWLGELYLDQSKVLLAQQTPPKLLDAVYVNCPVHGAWTIPRDVMLAHWATARASHRLTVKLDNASPWKSTDLW